MKRAIITIIFTLFAIASYAQAKQSVNGFVYNSDGIPIAGAIIKAVGDSAVAKSAQDGSFEMQAAQHCNFVEASCEGYISARVELTGTIVLFRLKVNKKYAQKQPKAQECGKTCKSYDQYVNLSYGYNCVSDFIGVNYIGGYRFNHLFFLGIGTGIDFALFTPIMNAKFAVCKPTRVNIPLYVNFRTIFLDKAWSPYISVSAGARISPKIIDTAYITYNQSGLLGDISFGVERKLGQQSSLYLGVGYRIESFIGAVPMYNSWGNIEDFKFTTGASHGFNVHIGISF